RHAALLCSPTRCSAELSARQAAGASAAQPPCACQCVQNLHPSASVKSAPSKPESLQCSVALLPALDGDRPVLQQTPFHRRPAASDRKRTRLTSSHGSIT